MSPGGGASATGLGGSSRTAVAKGPPPSFRPDPEEYAVLYLALGIRCLIGGVFLVSFLTKISGRTAFDQFTASVHGMRVLPAALVRPVAASVVAAEFAVCALLATPVRPAAPAGLLIAAGLLAAFTIGIARAVNRGAREPCRCFGASRVPLGPRHLARNAVLTLCAVLGAAAGLGTGPVHAGGVSVAVAAGLLLAWLVIASDTILDLFQPLPKNAGHRIPPAPNVTETSWFS
ncbi:MauE/DoxX family redox-associated membrane protein [Streptomyces sp. NPDC058220]|uniref:MauE/DoxX family redox-associated membrane protein n=1 Tax=Streptomyces sp. NPDC058220 TaxID=3346387 RepID=UPI0036E5C74B